MDKSEVICRAVASDFKLKGITHQEAAKRLGVETRTVSNQISGKRPFGKKSARRYSQVFGYDESYLLYGIGDLKKDTPVRKAAKAPVMDESYSRFDSLSKRILDLEQLVAEQDRQIKQLKSRRLVSMRKSRLHAKNSSVSKLGRRGK